MYEENGFFIVRSLLNAADVKKFYDRFDELVANPKDGPPTMAIVRDVALKGLTRDMRTSEGVVTKLQNWSMDRVLWDFARHPGVIEYVEGIIGSDIRAHQFMCINKPRDPGTLSSRHPMHQDQWYFPFGPEKHIVCAWTALQFVHRGNGGLCAIPGSHKNAPGGKLLPHGYPRPWNGLVNKAYHGILIDDIIATLSKRVHFTMGPGDTIFFHPFLLHASGANLSGQNRRAISTHYCNSKLCEMYDTPKIPAQKMLEDEIEELALRKTGSRITYRQIWKLKSRQVQGDAGCFKFGSVDIGSIQKK